jgi:hypothetical protein
MVVAGRGSRSLTETGGKAAGTPTAAGSGTRNAPGPAGNRASRPQHTRRSASPEDELTRLRRELAEAREQQAVTAEILRIISTSPTNVQPVLKAVAERAARLYAANDATIVRVEGENAVAAVLYGDDFREVFRRLGRKCEGTGLGLPLAKQFVELHGGRLWLESEPGRGSTFSFTLPVTRAVAGAGPS